MAKLRKLTIKEIKKLASRKGVNRIAVENFLATLTNNPDLETAIRNLEKDAVLYNWNYATRKAILDGIKLAKVKKRKEETEELFDISDIFM